MLAPTTASLQQLTLTATAGPAGVDAAITLTGGDIGPDAAAMPAGTGSFGFDVAVLDDATGDVCTATFDTTVTGGNATATGHDPAEALVRFLATVPRGRIVAICTGGQVTSTITPALRDSLTRLGAVALPQQPGNGWAFIARTGHGALAEDNQPDGRATVQQTVTVSRDPAGRQLTATSAGASVGVAGIWADATALLTPSTTPPGFTVAWIDPRTMAPQAVGGATAIETYQPSGAPGSWSGGFNEKLRTTPPDCLAVVTINGAGAELLGDGDHEALATLGAIRSRELAAGWSYVLIGRPGATPGTAAELAGPTPIRLSVRFDGDGYRVPTIAGLLFADANGAGTPLRAIQHDLDDPAVLASTASLVLAPGTAATIRAAADAQVPPNRNALVVWETASEVRLGGHAPAAIELWPAASRPPRTRWALHAPNGYLVVASGPPLSWAIQADQRDFVSIRLGAEVGPGRRRVDLVGATGWTDGRPSGLQSLVATADGHVAFVAGAVQPSGLVTVDEGDGSFSLAADDASGRWVDLTAATLVADQARRTVVQRSFGVADGGLDDDRLLPGEGVGPLEPGEIALYAEPNFGGDAFICRGDLGNRNWILLPEPSPAGTFRPRIGSLRLGPHTTATLYHEPGFGSRGRRDQPLEVTQSLATLPDGWQDDTGSIQVHRTAVVAGDALRVDVDLAEDHRINGDGALQPYTAYRATLTVPANVGRVSIEPEAPVQLTIGTRTYDAEPGSPVVVAAPLSRRLVVTADAVGLGTAALTVRTDTMASTESFVVHPDRAAHERLATRRDVPDTSPDAAAFATATGLNTHAQRALGHVLATVTYDDVPTVIGTGMARSVTSAAMDHPGWRLWLPGRTRGENATFRHVDSDAELDQAIAGATDGDADAAAHTRTVGGLWAELVAGAHEIESIIVHKVRADAHAVAHDLHVVVRVVENGLVTLKSFALETAHRAVELAHLVVARVNAAVNRVVETVRFAFSWPDILRAQRVLTTQVLTAFDGLPAAIGRLAARADHDLQARRDDLVSALDTKIAEYRAARTTTAALQVGAAPAAQRAVDGGREKMDWLLAKVADHHATPVPGAASPVAPPVAPELSGLVVSFAGLGQSGSSATTALQAATAALQQAVQLSPSTPSFLMEAILDVAKAAVIAVLDGLDALVQSLLAQLTALLAAFRSLLTQPWDLPYLSSLYRWLEATHGGGTPAETLNALNLLTLLVAVPANVVSVLASGAPLFPATVSVRDSATPNEPTPTEPPTTEPPTTDPQTTDPHAGLKAGLAISSGVCALLGSVISSGLDIQAVDTGSSVYGPGRLLWFRGRARTLLREEFDLAKKPTASTVLEIAATAFGGIGLILAWPGGLGPIDWTFPLNVHDAAPADLPGTWDNVTWVVEMCLVAIDVAFLLFGTGRQTRRSEDGGAYLATALGAIDLGFIATTLVMGALHGSEEFRANELSKKAWSGLLGAVPGLFPWLRTSSVVEETLGVSLPALGVIDVVFGVSSAGLAIDLANSGLA